MKEKLKIFGCDQTSLTPCKLLKTLGTENLCFTGIFFIHLTTEEMQYVYFQHDNAVAHTANSFMSAICAVELLSEDSCLLDPTILVTVIFVPG